MSSWTNKLLVAPFLTFALIGVSAPVHPALLRGAVVALVLGLTALACVRVFRMGIAADADGVQVRNLGRDYSFGWASVAALDTSVSDNVTQSVSTIVVRLTDGRKVVARGASAYSRKAVERCGANC